MQEKKCAAILEAVKEYAKANPQDVQAYEDWLSAIYNLRDSVPEKSRMQVYEHSKELRSCCSRLLRTQRDAVLLEKLYSIIERTYLFEARDIFDSYCIYLEWNRDPGKKFYQPRRKVLRVLAEDLQDLFYHKINFLGVSLPPRVGKALSDDTPILTRMGWKNHGDLAVGDEVLGAEGRFVKVVAVSPKCLVNVRCYFSDGTFIDCHENHEWPVYDRHSKRFEVLETKQMMAALENDAPGKRGTQDRYSVFSSGRYSSRCTSFSGFERIESKQGNCIQVEGGVYRAGKQCILTHNSTLCIFFITWLMGNRPDKASVMSGHSDKLTSGFYEEVLSIITDPETYNWGKIFPDVRLIDKSAKDESIDLKTKKRFPTLTCRSIGGTLTGAVEIGEGGVLYSDDLVEDLEESLNPDRLNAKYDAYLNQLKDRKKQGALELMVGTRWNVLDPLGRIHAQYENDPKYRFRVISAVDEDGHSNFLYDYGVGFDDEYYADMKASIDDATWCAKYMGNPYIREGLVFPADDLQYYNGVLPDGEPDRILMALDIAWGGGDFTAGPIGIVYGSTVYIPDVVFNDGDKNVTRPIVVGKVIQNKVTELRGEANNGGGEYCDIVDSMLREKGYHCNVRSQKSLGNQSKLGRIIQFAPDIKRFVFLAEKYQSKEYKKFMEQVTTFTQNGKVKHDDAPDSLAMLADELYNGIHPIMPVKWPF